MIKDVDGYLLTGSLNRKFIVKIRLFPSAKTIDWNITLHQQKQTLIQASIPVDTRRRFNVYTTSIRRPEISQNSQENTCARVSFLIKLQA